MVEANKLTLNFYRQTCRLIPAIVNRRGNQAHTDYHQSKLNVGKWIRKGAKMRDPSEVTKNIRTAYDHLFNTVYGDWEPGYYNIYLLNGPIVREDNAEQLVMTKSRGLNLIDQHRFKNKTTFLKRFIKGVRPLLH